MTELLKEFTYLFNLSVLTGKVPKGWKKATVIPIHKTNNHKNVTDLRPISLLPLPGKILEHLLHEQLMAYLTFNQLLSINQFGFRPGVSTIDAICTLLADVGLNMNLGKLTIATFIDFSKAFDNPCESFQ